MANKRSAGMLNCRLDFQQRGDADDGWGNITPGAGPFATRFTRWAGMVPRVGSEAVTAARLEGKQPYVVTVRMDREMLDVTTAWQLVDTRSGKVFAILSPLADPDGRRQWLEFLAQEGTFS